MEFKSERRPAWAVSMTNAIIKEAFAEHATEVIFERRGRKASLSFLVEGKVITRPAPPPELWTDVLDRLKWLGKVDLTSQCQLKSGSFPLKIKGHGLEIQVVITEGEIGERLVLKLTEKA